jgi:hypothetical protein
MLEEKIGEAIGLEVAAQKASQGTYIEGVVARSGINKEYEGRNGKRSG